MIIKRRAVHLAVGLTLALGSAAALAQTTEEIYIPLISKGFQHQFWQAVKAGAMQAGKDYHVKVSFDGPETEAMVDKQIDMLSAALAKKPQAIGFAALDSQAALPLLKKAQAAKIPVVAFDSGVDSDIPVTTATTVTALDPAERQEELARMLPTPQCEAMAEDALLLRFGERIDAALNAAVHAAARRLHGGE